MNLHAFQREFCAYLRDHGGGIAERVRGDADTKLAVYHSAYRMRLIETLRETFARLHAWLGDDAFDAAALRHIEQNAPSSWTLSHYGEGFEKTLRQIYPHDDEVPELAWLDWALRRAFDGPDARREPLPDPADVDWEVATLRLLPTLRWRSVCSNCAAIWTSISREEPPPAAAVLAQGAGIRVWRADLSPRFRTIDGVELHALQRAAGGASFGAICSDLAELARTGRPAAPGALLASWLQDGLIEAIEA